jgi:hypothetical protein
MMANLAPGLAKLGKPPSTKAVDSGGSEISLGVAVVEEGGCGGEDSVAVWGDAVKPYSWDFGDKPVSSQFSDQA